MRRLDKGLSVFPRLEQPGNDQRLPDLDVTGSAFVLARKYPDDLRRLAAELKDPEEPRAYGGRAGEEGRA